MSAIEGSGPLDQASANGDLSNERLSRRGEMREARAAISLFRWPREMSGGGGVLAKVLVIGSHKNCSGSARPDWVTAPGRAGPGPGLCNSIDSRIKHTLCEGQLPAAAAGERLVGLSGQRRHTKHQLTDWMASVRWTRYHHTQFGNIGLAAHIFDARVLTHGPAVGPQQLRESPRQLSPL